MIDNPFSVRRQREGWDDESNNQGQQDQIISDQINNLTIDNAYGTIPMANTNGATVSWSNESIPTVMFCTVCDNVAKYIYNGNSLCEECINRHRGEEGE